MKRYATLATAVLATGMVGQACAATATFITSAPYTQFSDSPFAALAAGNPDFHLETFEDGALNTPGVSASVGFVASPSGLTDSVDGDDGELDGSGNAGHSWYSGGASSVFSFSFDAGVLGTLPTHVGIVWTDIGINGPGAPAGFDDVTLRAFDGAGIEVGFIVSPNLLGDGVATGGTAEDRFFGVIFADGISRITLSSVNDAPDWEVDHLQYGVAAVPLPGTAWMLAPALAGLMGLRRKRV